MNSACDQEPSIVSSSECRAKVCSLDLYDSEFHHCDHWSCTKNECDECKFVATICSSGTYLLFSNSVYMRSAWKLFADKCDSGYQLMCSVQPNTDPTEFFFRKYLLTVFSISPFYFFSLPLLLRADSLYRKFADNASFALSSFRRLLPLILNNFSIFQLYSCVADGYLQFRNFLWIADEASQEVEAIRTKGTNVWLRIIEAKEREAERKTLLKFDVLMLTAVA